MPNPKFAVFTHPSVKSRLRFDLLSNGLAGLRFVMDNQSYPLGDLSVGGFCYLAPYSEASLQACLAELESGKPQVRGWFRFETAPPQKQAALVGLVKNVEAFSPVDPLALLPKVRLWISEHPEQAQRHQSAEKLEAIANCYQSLPRLTKGREAATVALQVSLNNLLLEAGLKPAEIAKLMEAAPPKPQMIKYGVEFFTTAQGMELIEFTRPYSLFPSDSKPQFSAS